jgi:hypothetical protein
MARTWTSTVCPGGDPSFGPAPTGVSHAKSMTPTRIAPVRYVVRPLRGVLVVATLNLPLRFFVRGVFSWLLVVLAAAGGNDKS